MLGWQALQAAIRLPVELQPHWLGICLLKQSGLLERHSGVKGTWVAGKAGRFSLEGQTGLREKAVSLAGRAVRLAGKGTRA